MKLGFIAMSGLRAQNKDLVKLGLTLPGFIERKSIIESLPSLGLLTLAGLTPKDINTSYIELPEYNQETKFPGEFDVVAISSYSAQINDAYLLADKYKKLGTKVILGGLHISAMPEEALKHADSIVLGEGEVFWNKIINDIKSDRLKSVYDARNISFDLGLSPIPQFELLDITKYDRLTVQTQRGCLNECEFCASSIRLDSKYKVKPVEKVITEIERIKTIWNDPFIEFADDNTFSNKLHGKRLAKELAKQKIKWFTETDISVAEDDELLALLCDSGCRQLLIGLESPSARGLYNLELKSNWKQKQVDKYQEAIHKIQSYGISVNGCFILGLDGTDISSFDDVFKFVKESELSDVQITILTPFPGTTLYNRLKRDNRLLKDSYWKNCTLFDVNYYPDNMTVCELENKFRELMRDIYSDELVNKRKRLFLSRLRNKKIHN